MRSERGDKRNGMKRKKGGAVRIERRGEKTKRKGMKREVRFLLPVRSTDPALYGLARSTEPPPRQRNQLVLLLASSYRLRTMPIHGGDTVAVVSVAVTPKFDEKLGLVDRF